MPNINKYHAEQGLKRKIVTWIIILSFLFCTSICLIVVGSILAFDSLVGIGAILLFLNFVIIFFACRDVKQTKEYINLYCLKCDTASLIHIKTRTENTGILKKEYISRGPLRATRELFRKISNYRCTKCGYELEKSFDFAND